ncbi:hypothetical protein REPUB_Repub01dG0113900 [Reevesia pubescens]
MWIGHCDSKPCRTGYGCRRFADHFTNTFLAEAVVARKALEFASELGFRTIILEEDSLCIIRSLQFREQDLSSIGPVIDEGWFRVSLFHKCSVCHVSRSCNMAAHATAKFALISRDELIWVEECHVFLQPIVEAPFG